MAGSPTQARHLPLFESREELRVHTWSQLMRTFYKMNRQIVSMLAERDVTMPQFDILATLRFSEGASQQELAERLLVSKGNMCGVLDRLERSGWVRRRADPQDARTNRLYLTAAGRKRIDALLPEHDALLVQMMRSVKDIDIKAMRRTLQELDRANDEISPK